MYAFLLALLLTPPATGAPPLSNTPWVLPPGRADAHAAFVAGRSAFQEGSWSLALLELERARVGLDPVDDASVVADTGWLQAQSYLALDAPFQAWLHLRDIDLEAFAVPDGDLLVYLQQGLLLARAQRWEAASARLLLPSLLLDDPVAQLRALRANAQALRHLRRPAEAIFAAQAAVDLVDPVADPLQAASLRRELAAFHAATGDFAGAVAVLEPGLALATAAGSLEWDAALALDLGDAWAAQGAPDEARAAYLRAVGGGAREGVPSAGAGDRGVGEAATLRGARARAQAGLAQLGARAHSLTAPLAFARAGRWARLDPAAFADVAERRAAVSRPRGFVRWMRRAAARWEEAGRPDRARRCLAAAIVAADDAFLGERVTLRILADVRPQGSEVDFLVELAREMTAEALATGTPLREPDTALSVFHGGPPPTGMTPEEVYWLLGFLSFENEDEERALGLAGAGALRLASPEVLPPDAGLAVVGRAELGLELGDILVSYGGTPLLHARDLPSALYTHGVGGDARLVVLTRNGLREVAVPAMPKLNVEVF